MPIDSIAAPHDAMGCRATGLRLVCEKVSVPVLRFWKDGLAVNADRRTVRGLVHLYEGSNHVATGLICMGAIEGEERRFHFKRLTFRTDRPPLDYAQGENHSALKSSPIDRLRVGL